MNLKKLKEPFPQEKIHFRVGATLKDKSKGIALAYIDARDVMDRLDYAVGPHQWANRYPSPGLCEIGIHIDGEWVWKADGADETDYESTKGQFSDAFKRAGVKWGIGRYLYRLPNEWYPIKKQGNSYVLQSKPKLPKWALPGYAPVMSIEYKDKVVEGIREALRQCDDSSVIEIVNEMDLEQKNYVWREFNSAERGTIKIILKGE